MIQKVNSKLFKRMIIEAANILETNENIINKLNVFPVPDADTGTNMYLTFNYAKEKILNIHDENIKLNELLEINANALLRGAKGNSGSILSLIFRGIMKIVVKYNQNYMDCNILSKAFFYGTDLAYKAVINPVDGTMLTVCRIASKKCIDNCSNFQSINDFFDYFIYEANEELTKTQNQNPILKKAGVVDAGAFGFICILHGMKKALLSDINLFSNPMLPKNIKRKKEKPSINLENIKYIYCTEAIIKKFNNNNSNFQNNIIGLGDSAVVFEEDNIIKFHIHTNNPDQILALCLKIGILSCIKIENMKEQHTQSNIINQKNENNNKIYNKDKLLCINNINIVFKHDDKFDLIINNKIELSNSENFINVFKTIIIKRIIELCGKNNIIFTILYNKLTLDDIIKQLKIYFPASEYKLLNTKFKNEKYLSISSIKK